MRLIVDVPEDIVNTLNSEEPLLSMKQEADLFEATYKALDEEICEDAISRKDMALNIVSFYNKATGKKKTLDFLCKCVEGLQLVQPKQRWIPVSEKLPEDGQMVLISVERIIQKGIKIATFRDYGDYHDFRGQNNMIYHEVDVVAWMPLPKPYKPE